MSLKANHHETNPKVTTADGAQNHEENLQHFLRKTHYFNQRSKLLNTLKYFGLK